MRGKISISQENSTSRDITNRDIAGPKDLTGLWSPKLSPSQVVYQNERMQVRRVEASFASFSREYFVVDSGVKAGMVVVVDGSLLMVRQYRLLIDGLSWEIPGGMVDDGENPKHAAVRECLEETGVYCLDPQQLLSYQAGLDTHLNPTHLFYCENVSELRDPQAIHEQEIAGFDWIPLDRCIDMISNGQIMDAFTTLAVLAYDRTRVRS